MEDMKKREMYTCIKMFRKFHISVNHSLRYRKISVVLLFHFYSRAFVNKSVFFHSANSELLFIGGLSCAYYFFFLIEQNLTALGWFEAAERICRRKRKVKTFPSKLFSLKFFQNHKNICLQTRIWHINVYQTFVDYFRLKRLLRKMQITFSILLINDVCDGWFLGKNWTSSFWYELNQPIRTHKRHWR